MRKNRMKNRVKSVQASSRTDPMLMGAILWHPCAGRAPTSEGRELAADVRQRLAEPSAVRPLVEPAARPGGMGERDRDRALQEEALAHCVREQPDPEEPLGR